MRKSAFIIIWKYPFLIHSQIAETITGKLFVTLYKNKYSTSSVPALAKNLESGVSVYYTTDGLNLYFTIVSIVNDSQAVYLPLLKRRTNI